jgi:ABC-type nickel/cobalt efflux system permease component RcnA
MAAAGLVTGASAHPLGNYTVNRAVAVTIGPDAVEIAYVLDMAEIPAFSELEGIDRNGDGSINAEESGAYASRSCQRIAADIELRLGEERASVVVSSIPLLTFPEGAGGLRTLRLVCRYRAVAGHPGEVDVTDRADDGHVGWREVTIAAGTGVRLTSSDVPSLSESALLTAYPADRLQSPPDVRSGSAAFELSAAGGGSSATEPATPWRSSTADDPLAAMIGGQLSPAVVLVGLLVAAGLGAAHALSPGHGKTLVAAYLVGSRGTAGQAVALGLTVAATHTVGVLVLGAVILVAGELLLPEAVIGWLTVISGGLMALLGGGLLLRALRGRRGHGHTHGPAGHVHPHAHSHGRGRPHLHATPASTDGVTLRGIALLGVAGGLVPSASALIVLLAAVTTGRLIFGLGLIAAFGLGMAMVLGGLAVATTLARGWLDRHVSTDGRLARVAAGIVPIGSGAVVLGIGLLIAVRAAVSLG